MSSTIVITAGSASRHGRDVEAFVRDEQIPLLVLVDDDATGAHAASLQTLNWFQLTRPRTSKATRATSKRGYHVQSAGDRVRYEHLDADSTDHAPPDEVIAALRAP